MTKQEIRDYLTKQLSEALTNDFIDIKKKTDLFNLIKLAAETLFYIECN